MLLFFVCGRLVLLLGHLNLTHSEQRLTVTFVIFFYEIGPNSYSLPTLLGKTREAGKTQRPIYSMTGRSKIGGFSEDLQKV